MKHNTLHLKAILVLILVAGVLSFKKTTFFPGTVYCFPTSAIVNTGESCNAAIQGGTGTLVPFEVSASGSATPCPSNEWPYDASVPGLCIFAITKRFASSGL